MERYAYSLDQKSWVGAFDSRDQAARQGAQDNRHLVAPKGNLEIWTAVAGRSPRAGELVPDGSELLQMLARQLGDQGNAGEWFLKLTALPSETHEVLRRRVADAVDGWVGALGLQPRFFSVEDPQRHSICVFNGTKREAG